ncbi:MAG TPA: hypothetical protein VGV38_23115 [Pyrinomonadaceae bacterium]|nr:hypothetical protein [Pyrinomonadaceae bacterium]
MTTRKALSRTSLLALAVMLACGLLWPTAAARQAQTTTDNETIPIAGTVLDCAGNPVELSGEMHILTHTTVSSSGHFNMVAHLNQQLTGTSADGTRHVMNQQLQDVFTGDASDGFPLTQTFEIHSNLNNNDPNVPQLHIRAILHVTFNANGEITGSQLVIKEECEGS